MPPLSSPAVVWLRADEAGGTSPLAEELARDHRVVPAAAAPRPGEFVLIGESAAAQAALTLARSAGAACTALVLIAPLFADVPPPGAAPDIPILLLLGTQDERVPPSSTAALCAALPRAHPILVYGAGHALDRERIEAVAAVVRDFIARRDDFIVRAASDVLYP